MKPESIGLTKENLLDLIGYMGEPKEGLKLISSEISDTSRWSIHHYVIFEFDGKFYSTFYSEGATENQDESPWEYGDPVLTEVAPMEQTITVYMPVS